MARPRQIQTWAILLRACIEMRFSTEEKTPMDIVRQAGIDEKKYNGAYKILHHPDFIRQKDAALALVDELFPAWKKKLTERPDMATIAAVAQLAGLPPIEPPKQQHNKLEVSGNITLTPGRLSPIGSLTPIQRQRLIESQQQALTQALPEPCIDAEYKELE